MVSEMMAKVDDASFDLTDKGASGVQQTLHFNAMREVRLCCATTEAEFRAVFAQVVNEKTERAGR